MSSKQLSSILASAPKATPAPPLAVVATPKATETAAPAIAPVMPAEEQPKAEAPIKVKREATPKAEKPVAPAAEPEMEEERSLQAYVPKSIHRAVAMRAAADGVTTRAVILQGLKAIGIEISEAQLRDRRVK